MQQDPGCIVPADWLASRLSDEGVVVADCRFELNDTEAGRRAYAAGHIPGAVYFDLERDLSGPLRKSGGRHPLPDMDELSHKLGQAGIDQSVTVVCYDDQKGGMAARLWWLLRYLGHDAAVVLDGGYGHWLCSGLPVTQEVPRPRPRSFVARPQDQMIASLQEVQERVRGGRGQLVDSRAAERYRGEHEPLDPVAGHIPGAANIPWNENVDDNGFFKEPGHIGQRWAQLGVREKPEDWIVYCGSGVTACANLLALERAGISGVRLYPGGWSEWCRDPHNPVHGGRDGDAGAGR